MPFLLRFNHIFRVCISILAGLGAPLLRAAILDYNTDEILAKTQVNISTLKTGPKSLADVFAVIEKQTPFTFVYVATQLPERAKLALESDDIIPLAYLLNTLTALTDLVFQRRGEKIVVRLRRKGEELATAPDRPSAVACSHAPRSTRPNELTEIAFVAPRRLYFGMKGAPA